MPIEKDGLYGKAKEPKSTLARYAYGYSNEKPRKWFWIIHIALIAFVIWQCFEVS